MNGAFLTEPVVPGSHAGVLFMDSGDYSGLSGHGIVAATTIALDQHLLSLPEDTPIVFDTVAGPVRARALLDNATGSRVQRVSYLSVPAFVWQAGIQVQVHGRRLRVDVAFGGAFFAIVDSEAAGLPIDASRAADLRRIGRDIAREVEAAVDPIHPLHPHLRGIEGTVFTAPPSSDIAGLRNVTAFANGALDRSPCATAMAALTSVLHAMELIVDDTPIVHESVLGTSMRCRVAGHTTVGAYEAIVPELEGSAWITGEHTFLIDPADPFGAGFQV
jgi:proline racemase